MTGWQLAQLNTATLLHPIDDPRIAGFVNRLDEINALAEAMEKLDLLRTNGPGPLAFTLKRRYPPPQPVAAALDR